MHTPFGAGTFQNETSKLGVSGEGSGLGVWGWVWGLGYLVGFGVGFAWVRVNDHTIISHSRMIPKLGPCR